MISANIKHRLSYLFKVIKANKVTSFCIAVILIILTISFIYSWYFDQTKPISGKGWADQNLYHIVQSRFSEWSLPNENELHYAIGYPLLGVIGSVVNSSDPFMIISYILLLSSALFCFYGAKTIFGPLWSLGFVLLLFFWDGTARSLHFASEVFAVPWNNQLIFFMFSFFFWLIFSKVKPNPKSTLISIMAVIAGVTLLAREESLVFSVPLMTTFLFVTKSNIKQWVLAFGLLFICFIPQLVVKKTVLGSASASGRSTSYRDVKDQYLQPNLLYRNSIETFVDSRRFIDSPVEAELQSWCDELPGACSGDPRRDPLLIEAPWLVIAPFGILIFVFRSFHKKERIAFVVVTLALLIFYLSGANMGAYKLKFHSIRYISASFILLNFGVVYALYEGFNKINGKRKTINESR